MAPNDFDSGDRRYRFGHYVLDPVRRVLLQDGQPINLTPRALDILCYLVEHHDRVVLKDELLAALWGDVVVEEGTLVRHVSFLRKGMHLSPDDHEVLVTVPGRGYRFVAKLFPVEDTMVATPASEAAGPQVPTRAASRWRAFWPTAWTGGVIAMALVLSLGGGYVMRTTAPLTRTLRPLTSGAGLKVEPTWSPDGRSVAFTSDPGRSGHVWLQGVDAIPTRATDSVDADAQPDWSPDGQWLVFRSQRDGGGIDVAPVGGGDVRRITTFGYRPRWSPDGRLILFSESDARIHSTAKYYVVGLDGVPPREVRSDVLAAFRSARVAWHPDGRRVSVWGNTSNGAQQFVTVSLAGNDVVRSALPAAVTARLADQALSLRSFAWAHSGRWLVFEGRQGATQDLWRVTVDPGTLAWTGDLERLTTGAGRVADVTVSRNDDSLAFSILTSRTRIWSLPLRADGSAGGEGRAITDDGDYERGFDIAPDGLKLVYRGGDDDRAPLRERSLLDGRERILASTAGAGSGAVRWSPDGSAVVYDMARSAVRTAPAIALVSSTSPGVAPLLLSPASAVSWGTSAWSADGRSVVGSCRVGTMPRLGLCLLAVSNHSQAVQAVRVLAEHPNMDLYQGRYSPDGRFLSFMAVPTANRAFATVFVVSTAGGPWIPITDGTHFDDKPRWSPDGLALYFVSNRGGVLNVWRRALDAATAQPQGPETQVTLFNSASRVLAPESVSRLEFSVTRQGLILPVTEVSGQIWEMTGLDHAKW